jgi:hypothetical protein
LVFEVHLSEVLVIVVEPVEYVGVDGSELSWRGGEGEGLESGVPGTDFVLLVCGVELSQLLESLGFYFGLLLRSQDLQDDKAVVLILLLEL